MADERKTQVTYQGNGTQRVYSFSFDYLRKAFVKVRLIDNETRKELVQGTEYTVTDKQITLASPTNLKIEIVRQTTTQPLVAWKDASVLKAVDMSVQEVQLLHLAEETRDEVRDGGMALSEAAQAWDARMHRIINLLDPQDPTDAVTLHYITANKESFLNELQTKGQEQVQGITQTGNTYLNRLNALKQAGEASASGAAQASLQAVAAQNKAKDWAISTGSPDGQTDTESSTGKTQSSRSWALIAKDLWSQCVSVLNEVNTYMQTVLSKTEETTIAAQQAFQAQAGAKQQATKATTQATQAAQSAQAAAKSAQQAATWNPAAYDTRQVSEQKYAKKEELLAAYDTRQVSEQKYAKKEETLAAAKQNGVLNDCLQVDLYNPFDLLNQVHLIGTETTVNKPADLAWGVRQVFYLNNNAIIVQIVGVNAAGNQTVTWYNAYNYGDWLGWFKSPVIRE
jgi:hypothetical protein